MAQTAGKRLLDTLNRWLQKGSPIGCADLQPGGVFGFGSTVHLGQLLDVTAVQGLLNKSTLGTE